SSGYRPFDSAQGERMGTHPSTLKTGGVRSAPSGSSLDGGCLLLSKDQVHPLRGLAGARVEGALRAVEGLAALALRAASPRSEDGHPALVLATATATSTSSEAGCRAF